MNLALFLLQTRFYRGYRSRTQGFTLIELLVVVIIIGILAAIALPSMLSVANRAKESEGRTNVGAVNRAQQTYRLTNPTFAGSVADLGLGITADTKYYNSVISPPTATLGQYQLTPKEDGITALTGCARANTGGFIANTSTEIIPEKPDNSITTPQPCDP